ncbi:MAG: endonuclease III [Planctomycetes bacterium]|nr:endonuclease III [Planctomycetota bacterium]
MKRRPKDISVVAKILSHEYHGFSHHNKSNALDELIFIICSTRTAENIYMSVYKALKKKFPTCKSLCHADIVQIEEILHPAGLSSKKAKYIKGALEMIVEKFGKPTLSPLKHMTSEECECFLTSLPNVGKKVARCIMMYSLDRQVFPVDTHCWRICRRLGWIRQTRKGHSCPPRDMDRLQSIIPPDLRYSMHVNLVSHGRTICTETNPKCSACPLGGFCRKIMVKASE